MVEGNWPWRKGGRRNNGGGMRWRKKNVQEGGGGAIIACVIVGENLYGPAVWNKKGRNMFYTFIWFHIRVSVTRIERNGKHETLLIGQPFLCSVR